MGMGYGEDLPTSERVFLAPQHGRLVTLARPRDSLVVRKFDIIAAMNRAGIDYLFVDSVPPLLARPGETYRYAIRVKSKAGGVEFHTRQRPGRDDPLERRPAVLGGPCRHRGRPTRSDHHGDGRFGADLVAQLHHPDRGSPSAPRTAPGSARQPCVGSSFKPRANRLMLRLRAEPSSSQALRSSCAFLDECR